MHGRAGNFCRLDGHVRQSSGNA
ncbi:MAG: hypothetical protein GX631_06840 [Dehalococcoidales bacterium]|nr:hypothetical protein [Dehalococcoidales bacterium]